MFVTKKKFNEALGLLEDENKNIKSDFDALLTIMQNLSTLVTVNRQKQEKLASRVEKLIGRTCGSIELFDADK